MENMKTRETDEEKDRVLRLAAASPTSKSSPTKSWQDHRNKHHAKANWHSEPPTPASS
jgi:hypothetical protein